MDLLKELKMSLLNFSFVMIYTIHKILILIKSHLNCLKDNIFKCLSKEYNIFFIFVKKIILFIIYNSLESLEEENITKDIIKLRQEKETKAIKDRIIGNINLYEHEEEEGNYYKPVRVSNFWSNNYVQYKSNGDNNKTLSVEEYLDKIRPYLKDINNLKKSDTWKIQLTLANNLFL